MIQLVTDASRLTQNSLNESPPRKGKEKCAVVDAGNDRFISFAFVVGCVAFFGELIPMLQLLLLYFDNLIEVK